MEMVRANYYYANIRKANFRHYGPLVRKHLLTLKDANAALGTNTYAKVTVPARATYYYYYYYYTFTMRSSTP